MSATAPPSNVHCGGLDCHAEGSHLATDFHVPCYHYLKQSLQQVTSHVYIFKGLTFHCCGYCMSVIPWTASDSYHKCILLPKIKSLINSKITCRGTLFNEQPSMSLKHSSKETAEIVHSCQQKSIGLKFSKSQTGSDVRYSCHHNVSRFTFPILAHSCRFSALHSLQSITPRIY